jgi:hypothetical protein
MHIRYSEQGAQYVAVVQVRVILLPTVSRPVRLGVGPLWSRWPHFKFLWVTVTFFLVHVERPLRREDGSVICNAITHWLESLRTLNYILHSHLRLLQHGIPGLRIYIPQEQGGPVIPPGFWFTCTFKFKLYYDRQSVGQFVLVWGPWPDFLFFVWHLFSFFFM